MQFLRNFKLTIVSLFSIVSIFPVVSVIPVIIACLLTLSSCATLTQTQHTQPATSVAANEAKLKSIKNWTIFGAIGVHNRQKAWRANLRWQQNGARYTMNFFGPLGAGAVLLKGAPNKVSLQTQKQLLLADNPEELLQREVGWRVPVSNLYYWVRGLAAPGIAAQKHYDQNNHLATLQQAGWQVVFKNYQRVRGIDLPSKIVIDKAPLRLRIVIKRWLLSATIANKR